MNSVAFIGLLASVVMNGEAFTTPCPSISYARGSLNKNRKTTKVGVSVNLIDAFDHIYNVQQFHEVLANAGYDDQSIGITQILSSSFLGLGETAGSAATANQPNTEGTLNYVSSNSGGLSAVAAAAASNIPSSGIFDLDGEPLVFQAEPKIARDDFYFYAQDQDMMSKLPLAALAFVISDFFFVNSQRVDVEDMYIYDEESYLEDTLEDTPEEIVSFAGQSAIRILLAVFITYATIIVSKMTYHPPF